MKLYVITTPSVTGGPHLAHQLVHELRGLGCDANIFYTDSREKVVDAYAHYDVVVRTEVEDDRRNVIVIPESQTHYYYRFTNIRRAIWWMSVDHYIGLSEVNWWKRTYSYFRGYYRLLTKKKVRLKDCRNDLHLYQSEYARLFLLRNRIEGVSLSDYLGKAFVTSGGLEQKISNMICYNPKKGLKEIQKIIRADGSKEFSWVPIVNMTPEEVKATLLKAMVYIDFGHHPGKDRMPREAALNNCIVITNRKGSADNSKDVLVPEELKIKKIRSRETLDLIKKVCAQFPFYNGELEEYRKSISKEYDVFKAEVSKFHDLIKEVSDSN